MVVEAISPYIKRAENDHLISLELFCGEWIVSDITGEKFPYKLKETFFDLSKGDEALTFFNRKVPS